MARPDWAEAVRELEVENQRHAEGIAAAAGGHDSGLREFTCRSARPPLLSVSSSTLERGDMTMSRTNFVLGARRLLRVAVLVVAAGAPGPARNVLAQAPAEARQPSPSPAELTRLAAVIKPSAEANKWQQIPWLRDVTEGRRLAKEEKRPLFLWTVFGEPLDEC